MGLADYSAFILGGLPKQGQTLEEVKDLLLNEIKKLRAGEFDEKMLQANINNFKLYELQSMESNEGRADIFVNSFINGTNWEDEVTAIDRMAKLTKEDIVAFADKYDKTGDYPHRIQPGCGKSIPYLHTGECSEAHRTCIPRLQERYEPADSEIRYSGTL